MQCSKSGHIKFYSENSSCFIVCIKCCPFVMWLHKPMGEVIEIQQTTCNSVNSLSLIVCILWGTATRFIFIFCCCLKEHFTEHNKHIHTHEHGTTYHTSFVCNYTHRLFHSNDKLRKGQQDEGWPTHDYVGHNRSKKQLQNNIGSIFIFQ